MCGDPTCEDPYFIRTTCLAGCLEGCFCNKDYVRENGVCIPADKCPQSKPTSRTLPYQSITLFLVEDDCSGANEVYADCGSGCGELFCGDDPVRICPTFCNEGCFCIEGYARTASGECVPIEKCPIGKG